MASFVTEVLRQARGISHAAHLVLLAIAAYVEEHGAPVYPSQATLATDSGVTERYVEACVQECEAAGYLQVERRRVPGKRPRNFYTVRLVGHKIPETRSGKPIRGNPFGEMASVEKKERKDLKDLQELPVQGNQFTEPGSPNAVQGSQEERAHWLSTVGLKPDFAEVCTGKNEAHPAQEAPSPAPAVPSAPTMTKAPRKPRGEGLYKLGKLCKRGHDHEGTGQTLRRLPSGSCLQCDLERQEAQRQAQVQARRAANPPRRIIDLSAHRRRHGG